MVGVNAGLAAGVFLRVDDDQAIRSLVDDNFDGAGGDGFPYFLLDMYFGFLCSFLQSRC